MKRLITILLMLSVFGMSLPAVLFAADSGDAVEQLSKVSLNAGSVSGLQVLPGVGAVTAERIVAYREKNGPYATVDALLNVKGIGVKTLEKISPMLEL
jgi:competence protein ComEA